MMPPSTKRAPPAVTISPIVRVVTGATALPSTKVPPKRAAATSRATTGALAGGHTDRMISLSRASRTSVSTSSRPSATARRRVASPRPADAQITREPPARAAAATELPISPGCRIPIVVTAASLARSSLRRASRTAKHRARPLRRLHEAARQQQHDGHEERAEDQQANVDPVQREVLFEDDVEHGPEHRPLERAHAADERHQQRVERPLRTERVRRVVADVVVGEESARQSGQRRRQRERRQLQRERADAGRLRRLLVLADRAHAEAEARGRERGHRDDRHGREAERQVVALREPVARDGGRGQRGDLRQHVADGGPQYFAEGQGADGEVGAAQPECRHADHQREEHGRGRARRHGQQHRDAVRPQRARDQRAEAEERGVAEIHLSGVAGDDVPRLREYDRQQDQEHEVQNVVARRREGQQREQRERGEDGGGPAALVAARRHRPKSPRGRTVSTTTKITSPTISRYGPPNVAALAASARPSTRPPTKVPIIEPSPARTTTINALSVHSSPMDGLTEYATVTSVPAAPASAVPSAKAR